MSLTFQLAMWLDLRAKEFCTLGVMLRRWRLRPVVLQCLADLTLFLVALNALVSFC